MELRAARSTSVVALVVTLCTIGCWGLASLSTVGAARSVRGFDGSTVKVAGFGIKAQLPGSEIGARARIKRFNDGNELHGVRIDYTEFADDRQDPATALSEARRLVTQVGVFALVGDVSQNNPGDYFNQQHVPYFGWAFDNSYCSRDVTDKLYGFGYGGCLTPSDPKEVTGGSDRLRVVVARRSGHAHPTAAIFSNDSQSGHNSVASVASGFDGGGFDIVYAKGAVPPPPVADYTPYVQQLLVADHGKAPDLVMCLLAVECIDIYTQLKANGYTGTYLTALYVDVLVKPLAGSLASVGFVPLSENTPGVTGMKADVEAFKPGAPVDSGVVAGYLSTDMFIQALKKAASKGNSAVTPERVQQAAAHQTWKIKGLAGPVKYPDSTTGPTPACGALVESDGTTWNTIGAYGCTSQRYPMLTKYKN
jgi:ABC-type branched-subunit amino acid transport system substrate-binding protein